MYFGECYDVYNQIYRIVELIEDRNREIHELYKKLYLQEYVEDDEKYDIIHEIINKRSVIRMYMSSIAYKLICIREGKMDKLVPDGGEVLDDRLEKIVKDFYEN